MIFHEGQLVRFIYSNKSPHQPWMDEYNQQTGTIAKAPPHQYSEAGWGDDTIYQVRFDNGHSWWCREDSVLPVKTYTFKVRRKHV